MKAPIRNIPAPLMACQIRETRIGRTLPAGRRAFWMLALEICSLPDFVAVGGSFSEPWKHCSTILPIFTEFDA